MDRVELLLLYNIVLTWYNDVTTIEPIFLKSCLDDFLLSVVPWWYFLFIQKHAKFDNGNCTQDPQSLWDGGLTLLSKLFCPNSLRQTIKCLLIHPNPESALNEEAGRLLLEDYAEYAYRAHLLTEIHAMGGHGGTSGVPQDPGDGPQPKKHAGDPTKRLAVPGAASVAALGNGANGACPPATTTSSNAGGTTSAAGKKKADKKRALRRL